jgi:molecular chaperone GrpE (heat shock protein)
LKYWFETKNDGKPLVHDDASSRKMKTIQKQISMIKNSLNIHDKEKLKEFNQAFENAKGLTEQKRQYFSNYGYENVVDYLNLETDELKKAPNYDRYELEGVVDWWKKLAGKRYDKLKSENRLRTELETWNVNAENIDIIR